jgi:hypothetical protein
MAIHKYFENVGMQQSQTKDLSTEIQHIFDTNKLEDLKEFINRRKCLNNWNIALVYLFHFIQSAGILTTTIAAGYDIKAIVWVGVGLNILASMINIFEKTNNGISKKLMKDIQAIKDGTYVDESVSVDIGEKKGTEEKNNDLEEPLVKLNKV